MTYNVTFAPAAQEASQSWLQPGNFVLTHGPGFFPNLIRFGQRLRFHQGFYSHAAGVMDDAGNIIEMLAGGATRSNISKYKDIPYHVVNLADTYDSAQERCNFWTWCAQNHVGYNFLAIASLGMTCLTGGKVGFGNRSRLICSGMVAAGLDVWEWRPAPGFVFPIELAMQYGVMDQIKKDLVE